MADANYPALHIVLDGSGSMSGIRNDMVGALEHMLIELVPRGGTALYDAVGMAINGFDECIEALPQHARPAVVQVVIVPDGFDNRSSEYTTEVVKSLVARQQAKGWELVFLGAAQDAVLAAGQFGIDADRDAAAGLTSTTPRSS